MRYRLIAPERFGKLPVLELTSDNVTTEELQSYNKMGYNIYYYPNSSSDNTVKNLKARHVDIFDWVFIDVDLTDGYYKKISDFVRVLQEFPLTPTKSVMSGHGIHAYWKIKDLDRDSYMRLQKALINKFKSDQSVWTIQQLMRMPGYLNTKREPQIMCELLTDSNVCSNKEYCRDDLWEHLDSISMEDLRKIESHIDKYIKGIEITQNHLRVVPLPERFEILLEQSSSLYEWFYNPDDRSKCDMRIANALQMQNFTREEAISILMQTNKGSERGISYVQPIIDQVFDTPLDVLDEEYEAIHDAISKDKYYDELALENKRYRIEQENKKVKDAKQATHLQENFTLHGFESELVNFYIDEMLDEVAQMNNRMPFITPALTNVVPLYGVNVILIAGKSGRGKSSTVANIAAPLVSDGRTVACISTEEKSRSTLLRVVCINNELNYNTRRFWINDQLDLVKSEVNSLIVDGKIRLYDSYTYGKDTTTGTKIKPLEMTTREGVQMALLDIEKLQKKPDVIMLDYITKVSTSTKNYKQEEWKVMTACCADIEEWSKRMGIPAIIFTQLEDEGPTRNTFKNRLPGAKRLFNLCTCVIELKANYEERLTEFIAHKNRDEGLLFKKTVQFNQGKFIDAPAEDDTVEDNVL
jgi:hypothetical protein